MIHAPGKTSILVIHKQTIRNTGPALWNSIPIHIKNASTIELFKRGFKLHLLSSQVQPYWMPCSTFFKLNNCIDITVAVQKKVWIVCYGGNIIFLYTTNPFCCHWSTYTAHKKFMNSFDCRGYDPYGTNIWTGRCQKTLVHKSAK